jgi:hypothetical protein
VVPERGAVLQVVGKRVDITLNEEWSHRHPRTRIVAIRAYDTVHGEGLQEEFDHCRVESNGSNLGCEEKPTRTSPQQPVRKSLTTNAAAVAGRKPSGYRHHRSSEVVPRAIREVFGSR